MPKERMSARTIIILLCCMAVSALASGADEAPDLDNGERSARGCLSCHAVGDFATFEADALATKLTSILAGETSHTPIAQELSELDIARVAAYLVNASSAAGAAEARDLENGERKGRSCLGCHALDNFATFEANGLATYLRAIIAGETGHMRIPPTLLSEQDIDDVAAWLVNASAASGD